MYRPSRRAVLIGGAGVILGGGALGYELIQDGTLPGKYALARLDGACGSAPPPPHGPRPARRAVSFYSAYRRRVVQMVTLLPPAARPGGLRVVIALHGSDSDAAAMAGLMSTAMTAASVRDLAVVCVDGGDTYWHKRADGDDPAGMIVHEVLPRARAAGLRTEPFGVAGLSMGGYGALLLAERYGTVLVGQLTIGGTAAQVVPATRLPAMITAVAALSPAIFGSYAAAIAANRGSFDSPADFAANDVLARAAALHRVPAWIACGGDDPFEPQTEALRARLAGPRGRLVPGGILPGCHDQAFWARNMPAALNFLAAHLA